MPALHRRDVLRLLVGCLAATVLGCGRSAQQIAAGQLRASGCEVRFKPVGQSLDAFWLEAPHRALDADFETTLSQLPTLETLILAQTKLTDAQLARLPSLPRMTTLDLSDNALTDACLPHLVRMSSLQTLILDGNSLTDAALPQLSELHGLRALSVQRTALSAESLSTLTTALPRCLLTSEL